MARIEASAIEVRRDLLHGNHKRRTLGCGPNDHLHHSISLITGIGSPECPRLDSLSIRAIRDPKVLRAGTRQWFQRRVSGFSGLSRQGTIPEFRDEPKSGMMEGSVLRQFGINFVCPSMNAAGEIPYATEPGGTELLNGAPAAGTGSANHDGFA